MTVDHDRLNGWKEIAAFLGKGVRTAQRWERDYSLPVHRQGANGDLIFAYRTELEAWIRAGGARQSGRDEGDDQPAPTADSTRAVSPLAAERAEAAAASEPEGPGPAERAEGVSAEPVDDWGHLVPKRPADAGHEGRPPVALPGAPWYRPVAALVTVVIVGGLTALALGSWPIVRASKPGVPARWHATADTLHVEDRAGQPLWSHRFGFDFEARLQYVPAFIEGAAPVLIDDLDEDGQHEVVATGPAPDNLPDKAVYVFNADGTVRFRFEPQNRVRFGDEDFAGPWLHRRTFILRPPGGGPPQLWLVYTHGQWFPSLLVRLAPDGRVLAEYWSDGFIDIAALVRWRGANWMFVAATNNETRGSSLALFPMGQVRGAAPSANPTYRCTSCPPGGPTHFVVFPRRCVSRATNGQEWITRLWVDDMDRTHLLVEEGPKGPDGHSATSAWYTLGSDLSVVDAEFTDAYHAAHARLEREGVLDHTVAAHGHNVLLPVRRWVRDHYQPAPVAAALTTAMAAAGEER